MTENQFEIIALCLAIPTLTSLVVGLINYAGLRLKFLSDKRIKTWDKVPFFMLGGEIEYIRDMEGKDGYSQYQLHIKIAKYCGIVFAVGFVSLITLGTASIFLMP